MPRRLGDDPLARAKTAHAAAASDSGSSQATVQSHPSYNDVFFQRRAEETEVVAASPKPEAPEISEISQLPEIREAASVQAQAPASEPQSVSFIEEVVAKFSSPAPAAEAAPTPSESASPPEAPQAPPVASEEPQKRGGFFSRLFGKR